MSGERILVVEDDPDENPMFDRALTKAGYDVEAVFSSEEAREKVAADDYDLILLDMVLETVESGLDFLKFLKDHPELCRIPVMTMSGHGPDYEGLTRSLEMGAADCVNKPVELVVLYAKIKKLLAEARAASHTSKSAGRVKALVLEDDTSVCELYEAFFAHYAGEFVYALVDTGEKALRELEKHAHEPFDAALIDWTLAGSSLDGYQILKKIRSHPATRDILAFMVTGNENPRDVEAAFAAGADDYVAKPFRDGELAERLRSRLRRRDEGMGKCLAFELEGLRFDRQSDGVTLNEQLVPLTGKERALICLFLSRPDRVLSSEHIWNLIWGYTSKTTAVVLSKHIGNLRKKLGTWGYRIEARRGAGYILNSRFPDTH